MICTCECPKTAEVKSGVASAVVAARVIAETANASPAASWPYRDPALSESSSNTRVHRISKYTSVTTAALHGSLSTPDTSRLIGPSRTNGATIPVRRRPATKVVVFQ